MAGVRRKLAELDRQLAPQKLLQVPRSARRPVRGPARVPQRARTRILAYLCFDSGVYVHPGHFYNFSSDGYLGCSA